MRKSIANKAFMSLLIAAMVLTILCAQASAMQLANLPKYDIELSVDKNAVSAGGQLHVTSHVVLLYYQMGKDPSVPGVYVEYELKGPSGVVSTASVNGITDAKGYHYADITMPSASGEYTIAVKAYDNAGGPINGQNEVYVTVGKAAAATVTATASPVTVTPVANTPLPPTTVPPTTAPTSSGGLPGNLVLIGAAILVLLVLLLVAAAAVVFFLLRRKKKPLPAAKPAPQVAMPAPVEPAPQRFCMHCGASMGLEAASCPKCGLTPPSGVDTKECPSCHTVIPEAAKYCNKCGFAQPDAPKK